MRTRAWAVLTISGGMLAALAGCGLVQEQLRDERTVGTAIREITVSGGGGSLRVRPGPEGSTVVKRHVRYLGDRPGETFRADGATLVLDTDCGRTCSVDYEVTAPRGVRVSGQIGSGDIDLLGVSVVSVSTGSGDVQVREATAEVTVGTGSGDITVAGATGQVAVKTGSGGIRCTGVSGDLNAVTGSGDITASGLTGGSTAVRTSSGEVEVSVDRAQNITAHTSSGDVRIRVPDNRAYRVDAHSSSGDYDVRVPTDPGAPLRLDLRTSSGNIEVAAR